MNLRSKFKKDRSSYSVEDQNNLPVEEQLLISKSQTNGWKRMTVILGLALSVQLILSSFMGLAIYDLVHKVRTTQTINTGVLTGVDSLLSYVANLQTQEAKNAREAGTQSIILQIDCNQRVATQELVNGLVKEGILEPDSVSLISPECKEP